MFQASRRDFIKIASLGAGGLLAGPQLWADSDPLYERYGIKKIPTYCEVCFWKCAGWVHFDKAGKPYKIVGNKADPLCNGRFCPRGTAGLGMYTDPDRLKVPLIRTVSNGKQTYKEATWPQAIDYIASKMRKVIDEHGAESLALFNHGAGGKHFGRLFKALGSGNIAAPSYAQCRGPREVAFHSTFGAGVNSPENTDIKNAKCLVLIGSHLGENMHNAQVQEMSTLIDKKACIIAVDPRLSTVASKSNFWLPIKPATDMALLLAWIHVLIHENIYDKPYVERHTFGFEDLKSHVREMTPEWAASITGLKADQIRETAWEMAKASPAVIVHPGRHVTWYGDDTQRIRAVAILNALLGSWGRKGGFYFPAKAKIPSYPHPGYPKPKWTWKDTLNGRYTMTGSAVTNAIIDASHPDNTTDKKIKGWFVVGTNLIHTIPDQKRTIEALNNQELVVVVDTMPMEITGYADVVLPECTYLERFDDLRNSQFREATIAVRMPVAKPKYLSKPASWMVRKLSKKFGLQNHFDYYDYGEILDWQLGQVGSSLEKVRKKGLINYPRSEKAMYMDEASPMGFHTATGKIELYSFAMEDEGYDPMPVYTPHPEPPDGYYRLNYGRAPMHTFSRTANNAHLNQLMSTNNIWVSPSVANKWNLKDGAEVWLKNQDGKVSSFPAEIRLTERMGNDSVYMVHGFGHSEKRLTKSYGKGICDTELMTKVMIDPIMGGTGMRGNFVTFQLTPPNTIET
ncbi:MAG: molybdopterin-dependent oxidoreductase [Reichenbachiella sp.]|uniref:molybdopterin-containing oxidoreductase family protein n=1 Tax=Reichenbachiella sp. TaxID=2184521 RepID=UPI003264E1C0